MRTRKHQFTMRLSDKEYNALMSLVKKSGTNRSAVIRQLIMDCRVKQRPEEIFDEMADRIRVHRLEMDEITKECTRTQTVTNEQLNRIGELQLKVKAIIEEYEDCFVDEETL